LFRHPDSSGKTPRISRPRAQALRRKDRFPKLPLGITLRETWVAMRWHWRELLVLAWLPLLVYVGLSFAFALLLEWFAGQARENLALYFVRAELLAILRAGLLEFLLVGFYALAVYRLMLLGEPLSAPRFSDTWLRRYLSFIGATLQAMLVPLLAFIPYMAFMACLILWSAQGRAPDFVPQVMLVENWPRDLLRMLCAIGFYSLFARNVFVQAATAVDVPYSPRESWRVTNWVWGHMLTITAVTLGLALLFISGLMTLWPAPVGALGFGSLIIALILACAIWLMGVTGFVIALSIAFCLRTGWRPGAQKLSLNRRSSQKRGL